ncbi:hypothetical protein [Mucilaginibacter myungsuensis]|uniref:Outer membrane lipoprotein-sorting protein n=1 Tax=Mucilaginibacter myungsuensis TaxID=649104 RepID=A0A929KU62_9SPHI|nr:hypothetical protein [Mucilaginibacter myungsuensis]MBE9660490.1 hypothetical protein [Mucilaginibacter myungsuensis]MDN3600534.1 hypothetical protein [Mucilaginibacter myungsuensis]
MIKKLTVFFIAMLFTMGAMAQHSDEGTRIRQLNVYQDTLKKLGRKIFDEDLDMERKNANYAYIRLLTSALKVNNSFYYKFDSVKTMSVITAPDNKFRVFSWFVKNDDGSYRFYGTLQMNTGGPLKMFPLGDHSPLIKNPEDSIRTNREWYGAQYYNIIPVNGLKKYYVLLGWKGNTIESTKKVIEVISFNAQGEPEFGQPVFDGNSKTRQRVVFEYNRQASMMLRYVPAENLIVFDHLAPPDKKMAGQKNMYGPDLSYDGYKLKGARWQFVENIDMKNMSSEDDAKYITPEPQPKINGIRKPARGK